MILITILDMYSTSEAIVTYNGYISNLAKHPAPKVQLCHGDFQTFCVPTPFLDRSSDPTMLYEKHVVSGGSYDSN